MKFNFNIFGKFNLFNEKFSSICGCNLSHEILKKFKSFYENAIPHSKFYEVNAKKVFN